MLICIYLKIQDTNPIYYLVNYVFNNEIYPIRITKHFIERYKNRVCNDDFFYNITKEKFVCHNNEFELCKVLFCDNGIAYEKNNALLTFISLKTLNEEMKKVCNYVLDISLHNMNDVIFSNDIMNAINNILSRENIKQFIEKLNKKLFPNNFINL